MVTNTRISVGNIRGVCHVYSEAISRFVARCLANMRIGYQVNTTNTSNKWKALSGKRRCEGERQDMYI